MASFDVLKELSTRSQGRDPAWVRQVAYTGAPATATAGVSTTGAIVTQVAVLLSLEPSAFSSRITVETADLTVSDYTVTIDGNAVSYDASVELPADEDALLAGIAGAINADLTVGAIVVATVEVVRGVQQIVLRNIGGEASTHTTAVSVAGGTGDLSAVEDATGADLRLWALPEITGNELDLWWAQPNGAIFEGLDYRGFVERFETSGAARVYAELSSVTSPTSGGTAEILVAIGPGVPE